uniref:Uncharacterized protein n=1 Tax=Strongyloides papillosus TaxID=174720 RepID=A0A0N5B6S7_STREA
MDKNEYDASAFLDFDNLTSAEKEEFYYYFDSKIPLFLRKLTQVDIGIIHLTLSASFFIFQLIIFTSFYNKKELFKNTCFHIIFHHGVLSCIQQICHIITAILTILNVESIDSLFAIIG